MGLDFNFTNSGDVTKENCLDLLQKSSIGYDYKSDLKNIIGGTDKGFHRWNQIYDVIYFLNEWKFPRVWLKILLVRGQEDEIFRRNFNNLLSSWIQLLKMIHINAVSSVYVNEISKIKNMVDFKSKINDPNYKKEI
ncbi:hypothetical protein V3Q77_08255 [Flavobacterium davisii]|uniref:Barstar (barnase inhibitor) domain-containing protein n=1 Tax=Flavobacterium davisii TaxID=2906077 RepID=A0ABW8PPM5_9FLAO|nr:hypothetical protein [Flavobacterium covae]OWP87764.1 hypothetical protein BWK60_01890 [Flavobacterium covae]